MSELHDADLEGVAGGLSKGQEACLAGCAASAVVRCGTDAACLEAAALSCALSCATSPAAARRAIHKATRKRR